MCSLNQKSNLILIDRNVKGATLLFQQNKLIFKKTMNKHEIQQFYYVVFLSYTFSQLDLKDKIP